MPVSVLIHVKGVMSCSEEEMSARPVTTIQGSPFLTQLVWKVGLLALAKSVPANLSTQGQSGG